jgi:hypothetical protein
MKPRKFILIGCFVSGGNILAVSYFAERCYFLLSKKCKKNEQLR